jgi:hypothetical protein
VARIQGIFDPVLALDEYYTLTGILGILETGLPAFPGGGFYERAPLFHYFAAGPSGILADPASGLLVATTALGLASVVAAVLYATHVSDWTLAAALGAVLSLSSWQVDYSLFGRMYGAFQLTALIFFLALWKVFERPGSRILWLPVLTLIVTGTHLLGLLFFPLLALPLCVSEIRRALGAALMRRYVAVSALTAILALMWYRFDSRSIGIGPPYPEGYAPGRGDGGPIASVHLPFLLSDEISGAWVLLLVGFAGLAAGLWTYRREEDLRRVPMASLAVAVLVAGLLHQVALVGVLAGVLFARYLPSLVSRENRGILGTALAGVGAAVTWLAAVVVATEGLGHREWLDDVGAGSLAGGVRRVFMGLPDLFVAIVDPWPTSVAVLGVVIALAAVFEFVRLSRKPLQVVYRDPAFLLAYFLLILSFLDRPGGFAARYYYFLYPLGLLVVIRAIHVVADRLTGERPAHLPTIATFILFFVFSGDFNPAHLAGTDTSEVKFRTGRFAAYEALWYPRWDNRSAALFLDQAGLGSDDIVVAADTPPFSYYYSGPHFVYVARMHPRFPTVSRQQGTVDLWSGRPLLSTAEELLRVTSAANDVWIITRLDHRPVVPTEVWGPCLRSVERAFLSLDGRIEVLHAYLGGTSEACS